MTDPDDGNRQTLTKSAHEGGYEEAFYQSTQLKAYAYSSDPEMYRVTDGLGDCDGGTDFCTRLRLNALMADTNLDKDVVDELEAALAEAQAEWNATMEAAADRIAKRKGIKERLEVATAWYDDGIRLTVVHAHHGKGQGHLHGGGKKKGHSKH